ncbi:MAG TPA: hypothetical protein VNO32_60590 [Candidatus Acidoferrum sp.]|nr:hypothetical protein [Candidatus Acidoferrum sp.]
MRRRVKMVLASAALAGSLLATDAQARGSGGHGGGSGGGHMGGFGGAHIGAHVGGFGGARMEGIGESRISGFGGARIGGFGGGYMAGIHRGYFGDGTGIRRGRFAVSTAPAFGQTAIPSGYNGAYASAPALGAVPNPPVAGSLPEAVTGPGLNIVGRDGVSTKTVRAVPCSTVAQETDGTTTCVGLQ